MVLRKRRGDKALRESSCTLSLLRRSDAYVWEGAGNMMSCVEIVHCCSSLSMPDMEMGGSKVERCVRLRFQ
jgi:hypothetical protein